PIVHVHDIAAVFLAALTAPRAVVHNQAFNVGVATENYQVRELAEIVRETVPHCTIEYAEQAGPDPRSYRVDFTKLARLLPEFRPAWNARTGARELAEGCRAVRMELQDFQSPRYIRLLQFKRLLAEGMLDSGLRWQHARAAGNA